MADAADSKSAVRKDVWVRLPPRAQPLSRDDTLTPVRVAQPPHGDWSQNGHSPSTRAAVAAAALACCPGSAWAYTSSVKATDAWPNRSETTRTFVPAARRCVACVCRRSCSRIRESAVVLGACSAPCAPIDDKLPRMTRRRWRRVRRVREIAGEAGRPSTPAPRSGGGRRGQTVRSSRCVRHAIAGRYRASTASDRLSRTMGCTKRHPTPHEETIETASQPHDRVG